MKLRDGIYLAASGSTGLSLTHPLDCNCYVIRQGGTAVLIDTGAGYEPERILEEMRRDGMAPSVLSAVFLTHCHADHAGNASYFRERWHIPVYAPDVEAQALEQGNTRLLGLDVAKKAGYYPKEYELTPCRIDRILLPGQDVTVGELVFRTYPAGGHSPQGICYACETGGRHVLLTGDLLDGEGKVSIQIIPGADVGRCVENIRALKDLPFDVLLPGHKCMSLSEGFRVIEKAVESFGHLMLPV